MAFKAESAASLPYRLLLLCIAFCLVSVLMKAIQLYYKRQTQLKTVENFPGPPSHWLYGNIHQITSRRDEMNIMLDWAEKFPYAYPRWFGGFMCVLMINHPDYVKTVFGRGDPKSLITYKSLIPWIGRGLLVLNGPKWHQHRRMLTPAFHYDILKPYVAKIADSTKVMLDKWEKLIAKDPTKSLEMFDHISLMSLDSIMKCAFNYKSNCQTDRDLDYYVKAVSDLTYLVFKRVTSGVLQNDLLYLCTPSGRHFKETCKLAHRHTEKVIEERKKSLQNERELKNIQKKRHLDFLDILLCAKDENGVGLSDEDLRAEVDTFMFEGHDTTASGISWLLHCMAQHPEHQQRCREEIEEILGDREDIQWDDLSKMTYVTMCIKESLRLYPPVPGVFRQLSKPVTFLDGRTLPKGFVVAVSIHSIHKNPSIWQDPEVFDPTRFSAENSSQRHSHAFIPFAAGARNCIGQQFAMNEMKIALALTLLRFEILPDPANLPIPVPQIVLKSENGIHLFLKKHHR
ncbi:cytochrome P450 4A25-like [Eublepharis macularius]|uniref:Cytochrome P450 4A25-like n=1 Tax=Eublepharis macularius TaxID=481883 RepID=A0AA97JDD8_EUBMA|nr:cytochrome P450 4A25-like [Eublepharis macularius]